jgi:phage/plasmid replication protein, gene II/X family
MIQCDWITAKIVSDLPHLYDSGRLITLGPHGEFLGERRAASFVEDSSSSSRLQVLSRDDRSLWLSGNPCKIFQGHNLWGPADPLGLFLESGLWVRDKVGLFPSPSSYEACGFAIPRFTRIDLTRSYRFPTHKDAQEFIRWAAASARTRHGAAVLHGSETVYFGKHSTMWGWKIYDKASEYAKHKAKNLLGSKGSKIVTMILSAGGFDPYMDWARGVVRFELTLRSPELNKIDPDRLALFTPDDFQSLWQVYFDRIQWTENALMSRNLPLDRVPPKLRPVLIAWSTGADLRKCYAHNTFYRHRRVILEATGVDIALPPPDASEAPAIESGLALDPKGWDPEPFEGIFTPREEIKREYLPKLFQ